MLKHSYTVSSHQKCAMHICCRYMHVIHSHGFCNLDPSNQEELGVSWVVDTFLSKLLWGNCTRPTFSINQNRKDEDKDEEENNDFDPGSVIGFQLVLKLNTLMVTLAPVPSNILH